MANNKNFDVIIIGGSYAGLSAGMALGRALRQVLIIDSGQPCNIQTPHSHNFITQDGKTPKEISTIARKQVEQYKSLTFFDGLAVSGTKTANGFSIQTASNETFSAKKLIFATGVKDIMLDIQGFAECWGISIIHCPYCHGYEVRNEKTGILSNGNDGFEFSKMIQNWTKDLTLFTNGKSTLTDEQTEKLKSHNIQIVENEIAQFEQHQGRIENIIFKDGSTLAIKALYSRTPFKQHCAIPIELGCELTELGHLKVDMFQKTTVAGIFACGDNMTMMRSVSNVVATGTLAGVVANKEITEEAF